MTELTRSIIKLISFTYFCRIAILAALLCLATCARPATSPQPTTLRLYIGTGVSDSTAGIYAAVFDIDSGTLSQPAQVTKLQNPNYLVISKNQKYLYAVHRDSTFDYEGSGALSGFRINAENGDLSFINKQSARGRGPCYVAIDTAGQWVLTANYGSGSVPMFPVASDGSVGAATDVRQLEGSGPDPRRQQGPHAHTIRFSPDGRFAFAADLGSDKIWSYIVDRKNARLRPANPPSVSEKPGAGPRHLAFHPDGRFLYVVNELIGTVTAYAFDGGYGTLRAMQTISTLPDGFTGYNKSADIHVHPNGRWLYASNRGESDSIVVFSVDQKSGRLRRIGFQRAGIKWPRNFVISPDGQFLLVANRHADGIQVYRINPDTGKLAINGLPVDVPQPVCLKFAEL